MSLTYVKTLSPSDALGFASIDAAHAALGFQGSQPLGCTLPEAGYAYLVMASLGILALAGSAGDYEFAAGTKSAEACAIEE